MTARPRALSYALAALALVAVIGLGLRLAAQVDDYNAARDDLAGSNSQVAQLRADLAAGVGPPLLDARFAAPSDQLAQRLKSLGISVREARQEAASPAGRNLIAARFTIEGQADAAAIDRLALWVKANGRSVILETLSATAAADGKSDVKLELDALVRAPGASPS
jgi:hypothetical protein